MKKVLKAATVGISLYASSVFALPDSAFYVGGLLGDASFETRARTYDDTDKPGKEFAVEDSSTFSLLVTGGMRFTDSIGMELQYMSSVQPDQLFGAVRVNGGTHSPMDLSMNAMGIYAFFQGGEEAFFKLRVGLAQTQANFKTDFATANYSTPNLSFGASIGQKMGSLGSLELIIMHYPKVDIDRFDFAGNFSSATPGFADRTVVADGLRAQLLALGYVFQF